MSEIIAIANQKGGVGKTTTAINLSSCLAKYQKKVLIVDLDPQGNCSRGIGIDPTILKKTIFDVIIGEKSIKNVIIKTVIKYVDILPANLDLAAAEGKLISLGITSGLNTLKQYLTKINNDYDYIIIDCPPSLGFLSLNALTAANSVLIPVQCEYFVLEGLGQLMNTINIVKKHLNKEIYIEGAVLTMYDLRTNLANQVVKEVKRYFENKVYKTVIPRNVKLSEAPSYGMPIITYDPKSKGAKAYDKLAKEFIKRASEGK